MAAIARMNGMLTATAGGFVAGMKQGERALGSFRSTFAGVAAATAAYDLGKTAIIGAWHATVGLVSSAIEAQGALHDQAAAIGLTTEALGRLQFAARDSGVDAESLAGALSKMNNSLADAATKGGPTADALAKLGLDAQQLANMAPDQAFAKIADSISKIENPALRTQAAMDIFGKQGSALIPVLAGGADGLQAAASAADAYGFSVSQIDNNKVDEAGDSMGHVGMLMEGVGNQLAVGLSPYITAAANQFLGLATEGGGVGPKVSSAIEWVTETIAYASDYLSLFQAGWYALNAAVLGIVAGIVKGMDLVGEGIHGVTNLLGVTEGEYEGLGVYVDQFADDAVASMDKAAQAIQDFNSGKNSKAVSDFFAKARADAQAAAEATGGPKTGAMPAGATDEDQAAAKEAEKTQKEAESAAKRYYESTRTAAEKYAAEVERINELQRQGLLDAETAQRAKDAAQKALDESNQSGAQSGSTKPDNGPGAPKLLQSGSAEAAKFVADIQNRERSGGEQKTLVKQSAQGNKYLAKIADNVTSGGSGGVTVNVVSIS